MFTYKKEKRFKPFSGTERTILSQFFCHFISFLFFLVSFSLSLLFMILFIELSIMRFFCPYQSSVMFFILSFFCRHRRRYSLLLMIVWCKYACTYIKERKKIVFLKFIHGCVPDSYRVFWNAYTLFCCGSQRQPYRKSNVLKSSKQRTKAILLNFMVLWIILMLHNSISTILSDSNEIIMYQSIDTTY